MQVSNYILIAALEVYLALILIALFLLFHSRAQKRLIRRQQAKLLGFIHLQETELKKPSIAPTVAPPTIAKNYKAHLAQQLTDTINHFQTLSADSDITLPQPVDSSLPQKAAALRYRFLQVEDVATHLKNNSEVIDWNIFEQHLTSLLSPTPEIGDLEAELGISKKRIENLERFKQLFFSMEKQWQAAQQKAQSYHAQLSEMSEAVEDKAYFIDILERYHNVYNEVNESIVSGRQKSGGNGANASNGELQPKQVPPNTANEIIKLRNVAVDQHRIITQLQRKLEDAHTAAEKEGVITELQQQLHRQIRFVQEAETCIKLLEHELATSHEKSIHQEQQLENIEIMEEENQRIKKTLGDFVLESKALMTTIIQLEQDKADLNENRPAHTHNADTGAAKKLQNDFLVLQTQYAELKRSISI